MKVLYPTFSFLYIPAACTLQCPKKLVLSSDPDPALRKLTGYFVSRSEILTITGVIVFRACMGETISRS